MMFIFKLLSQLLILIVGVINVAQAHLKPQPNSRKRKFTTAGIISLLMLFTGFVVFVFTEGNERKENAEKAAGQEKTIGELRRLNEQLTQVSHDRDLRELQISFSPSAEQSSRIAEAYSKIKSPVSGFSYSSAAMKAERIGHHWKIDFDPVSRPEGVIRFKPVLSGDAEGKMFAEVLRQASSALWIKWGAGEATELEPKRDQFPSAIVVSPEKITYVLRPPLVSLNLNQLNSDPTFTLRGEGNIKTMRFLSQDSGVKIDQTVELDWKEDPGADQDEDIYIKRTKPFISGPHRLNISFKTVP